MIRDRGWMEALLARATAAGCGVLVLTADLQTSGVRYRDTRSGFARRLSAAEQMGRLFEGISKAGWTRDVWFGGRPHSFGNLDGVLPPAASFAMAWEWLNANFDPRVTWDDLAFVRRHWQGPIVIKGIMTVADAQAAVDHGVDGIIVSNHGGRQLDGGRASISALPDIADAVGDRLTVLMDGGVRSGVDVVKAMTLGARACLIGRPWAYALATAGEAGVAQLLGAMAHEIRVTQMLSAHLRF
jgi:L-lactate dehydrogenase (cytochrome)